MTTFVLIHGAYQGGLIWKPVADRLRNQGHLVLTPSLDGCSERKDQVRAGITTETHAAEIAELLFYQDLKDVVLAGTSTGGMVMACAAERGYGYGQPRFSLREYVPVAVVIVPDVFLIKLRWSGAFEGRTERLSVPAGDNIDPIGVE